MDEHMKNYLAHHGVAGQKWGQRHGPPYPLNSNPSKQAKLKAKSKSSYNKLYGGYQGISMNPLIDILMKTHKDKKAPSKVDELKLKQQRYDDYTDKIYEEFSNTYKRELKNLLDTPITIAKDQSLQRYSTHKKLSDEKWHSDYSFVSYTKKDDLAYKTSALGNKLSEDFETKEVFRQSLKANRDLKIMPFSEVMTLVKPSAEKDTNYKSYVLGKFADESYIKKFVPVEDREGYFKNLKNNTTQLSNMMFERYGEPEDGYSELVNEASKRGYQGMIDIEDFIRPYFDKPVILFDPNSNVRDVSSSIVKKTSDKPIYDEYTPRMENYYKNDKIGVKKLGV
jgi:hypothetical protein